MYCLLIHVHLYIRTHTHNSVWVGPGWRICWQRCHCGFLSLLHYACGDTSVERSTLGGPCSSICCRESKDFTHSIPQRRTLLLHTAPPSCWVSKCHTPTSPAELGSWERGGQGSHPRTEDNTHLQGEFNKLKIFISLSFCYLKVTAMYSSWIFSFQFPLLSLPTNFL